MVGLDKKIEQTEKGEIMNDTYCETIIKCKMGSKALMGRMLAVIMSAVTLLICLMIVPIFGLIAAFFLVWLDIVVFRNTDIEYEYQYVSGDLDIDVIYGKTKRKKAQRFDMRKIEVFAPVNSDKLSSYRGDNIKVMDYSSGYMDRKRYAFVITLEGGQTAKVIFEPTEKMVDAVKYVAPSKVHMY